MMSTTQGEFATRDQAQRAIDALKAAGVSATHVRQWNIIPPAPPEPANGSGGAARAGAVTGALLGGLSGAVLGGVVGRALGGGNAERHMPDPTGVRVIVELVAGGPDAAAILRAHGASNVT